MQRRGTRGLAAVIDESRFEAQAQRNSGYKAEQVKYRELFYGMK